MVWISKFGFAPLALMFGLNLILWIFWGFSWTFFILLILTALLFRTPRRSVVCEDKKAILAPMDSEILKIENVKHKDFGECVQVSFKNALYNAGAIFASSDFETFDIKARHGLFLSPKFELASAFNERLLIIAQKGSQSFGIRLMAGSFDRKIKLKNEKASFKAGEELGFSINSSLVLFLPKNVRLLVGVGDEVRANSLIGYFA